MGHLTGGLDTFYELQFTAPAGATGTRTVRLELSNGVFVEAMYTVPAERVMGNVPIGLYFVVEGW